MAQLVSWGGQNNLKAGQLALAQQYADAGMMARAQADMVEILNLTGVIMELELKIN